MTIPLTVIEREAVAATPVRPVSVPVPPPARPTRRRRAQSSRDEPALQTANLSAILTLAVDLHERGQLEPARQLYRRILRADPALVDALQMLGLLHHGRGEHRRGLRLLRRAAELAPTRPSILSQLGECYRSLQRFDHAITCFERVVKLTPDDPDAHCNLGHAHLQAGAFAEAARCYRRVLEADLDDLEALTCLAVAAGRLGDDNAAAACYRQVLAADPDNSTAQHLLAAITGETTRRAPAGYVRELYDQYAGSFDAHLVETLRYDVPDLLRRVVDEEVPASTRFARAADLGCGTGLAGVAIRDRVDHLTGIDLSSGMLRRAADRGIYDELIEGELVGTLGRATTPFDLLLATDVLIYLGALEDVFAAAATSLRPGGWLGFSTERARSGAPVLQSNGRYAHPEIYIRSTAAGSGLDVVRIEHITVRIEQGRKVRGQIFLLRRPTEVLAS
ncbi:MAG: tetratricopeptide repeat protein [Phycisphaerales bacterium]|nr:tetratricopeptide repeat protein [Phycisphaerae bacterium]NNM24798.1 tetratricopeptide repeat protein [Phycisphaerales bacterium]